MEAAFKGAAERSREEWKRVAYGAHQTAALQRAAAKKFPTLQSMLKQFDPRQSLTPERAAAMVARLAEKGQPT